MGIAQAGIAFRSSGSVQDMESFMSAVFDEPATEIPLPVSVRFDIRNHSDVMVQTFGEVCFISNDDLAWPLIRNSERDIGRLHAALGSPEFVRVRFGVGRPPRIGGNDAADYVLRDFSSVERRQLPLLLDRAADAVAFGHDLEV